MEPHNRSETNYWNSVAVAGLIFGLVIFAINIVGGYMTINSEATGTMFGENMIMGLVGCLIASFGGLLAVKMHVRDHPEPLLIGTGAIIGMATGAVIALASTVLGLIWNGIDPAFSDNLMQATIANIEAMDQIPEGQKEEMIDSVAAQMQRLQTAAGMLIAFVTSALLYGILNMLTGMLGVRLFAAREEA
ncbi:MAG: DUF4199 domain-containing protein [Balneolales bacterium]